MQYKVNIYFNNGSYLDFIEVDAETKEEAEEIGLEEYLQGLKDNLYAAAESEDVHHE